MLPLATSFSHICSPNGTPLDTSKINSKTPPHIPHHVKLISLWMKYLAATTDSFSLTPLMVFRCFHWYQYSCVYARDTASRLTWLVPFNLFHAEEVRFRNFPNPFIRFLLHHLSITFLRSSSSDLTPMSCDPQYLIFHTSVITLA